MYFTLAIKPDEKVPKHDMLIVLGGFNAKVDDDNKGVER